MDPLRNALAYLLYTFQLLELLLTSFWKAVTYLSKEVDRLMRNCMKYQQPSRKSTLELLEEKIDLKVEDLSARLGLTPMGWTATEFI